uniref:Single-stranded DNA binding protein n=1 Tax=Gracilaria vermiculophylla TaxID=2608709 RepID=A0A345U8X9_9FLOR|nr:hypothetical protein [Gracilaria vermiculophylla]AXI96915.1 hypothetical protein [Gracilaria vermiculophylla]QXU75121.1 hypothetical protein [Gracilaria vermiculophylla]WDZ68021.1 hypothetical protein [Gracilaria vermiculophylla]
MNIFICTAYLISQPKLIKVKQKDLCYILISLYNYRDNTSNIKIKALARGKVAKQIFDLYQPKHTIVIESSIYIKKKQALDKYKKGSKMIFMKIHKIHNSYI